LGVDFPALKENQLQIIDQLAELELNAKSLRDWADIIIHAKNNQLFFVLVLARSDRPPEELKYWVEIVKHGKDNQLSIIGRLAATKFPVPSGWNNGWRLSSM